MTSTSVTIAELKCFHALHYKADAPYIAFEDDDSAEAEANAKEDDEVDDITNGPSIEVANLVNDYYNLTPTLESELSEQQRAYMKFREIHRRAFEAEQNLVRKSLDHGDENITDAEEELDY